MKLTFKRYLFSTVVVDENDRVIGKIKRVNFFGPAKKIMDAKGNVRYVTDIVNECGEIRRYIVLRDRQPVAGATFEYDKKSDHRLPFAFPRAGKMQVKVPGESWLMERQKDNSLFIQNEEDIIGKISAFFKCGYQTICINRSVDALMLAAVYIITGYMMHEDDVIAV